MTTPDQHRRLTVLVIDDEPAFLRSVQLVLDDAHDVVVESRSKNALDLILADPERFDAILCDLSMPEIDGVAFFGHVEKIGIAHRFILMTAGAFTSHGEQFLRRATCRRLVKPFTLDQLLDMIAEVSTLSSSSSSSSSLPET